MNNPSGRAGFGNGWSPLRYMPPAVSYQATRSQALGAAAPSSTILDSPLLSLATDLVAAGASAYLALGLGKLNSGWATFWWIASAAAGVKALHDLARGMK